MKTYPAPSWFKPALLPAVARAQAATKAAQAERDAQFAVKHA